MDRQTCFNNEFLTDALNTGAHPNGQSFADKLVDIVQAIDGFTDLSVAHTLTKDISVSTSSIADMAYVPPNDVLNTDISNLCQNPIDNHFHSSVVESESIANNMELSVDTNTRHSTSANNSYNTEKLPQFCESFGNRVFPPSSSVLESCAVSPNSIQFATYGRFEANSAALTTRKSVLSNYELNEPINSKQTQRANRGRPHKGRPPNNLRNYRNRNKITLEQVLSRTEMDNKQLNDKIRALENEIMFVLSLLRQRGIFSH